MGKLKYTKELLEEIVSKSVSLAQVIRSLSLKESGSSYTFETSYTEVGKTLGVSDNSVRKRLKNH